MVDVCSKTDSAGLNLQQAMLERDQVWRVHEKAQINFLQNQNAQMLGHLHTEIERLMNINRELTRKLNVNGGVIDDDKIDQLEKRLEDEEQRNLELEEESAKNQKKALVFEKTLERTVAFYKDELSHREDRIRQLTAELHDRTQTVTQLSTQLRSIKLREAMAQAQQRRRTSYNSPKSPSSPVTPPEPHSAFRIFGFYPGKSPTTSANPPPTKCSAVRTTSIKQPLWPDPMQAKENNIERPRTLSTSYITTRPRHMTSLKRTGSTAGEPL